LSKYSFGIKDAQVEEDISVQSRMNKLQNDYELQGMRRTVEGVIIVHEHGHPHILLLKLSNSVYKLPGDVLLPGEDEMEGLKSRLQSKLVDQENNTDGWEVGELVGCWWRPNFDNIMYPYNLPHIKVDMY
jgi:cleavage and polyadenylation specificity factor subunit 5